MISGRDTLRPVAEQTNIDASVERLKRLVLKAGRRRLREDRGEIRFDERGETGCSRAAAGYELFGFG